MWERVLEAAEVLRGKLVHPGRYHQGRNAEVGGTPSLSNTGCSSANSQMRWGRRAESTGRGQGSVTGAPCCVGGAGRQARAWRSRRLASA